MRNEVQHDVRVLYPSAVLNDGELLRKKQNYHRFSAVKRDIGENDVIVFKITKELFVLYITIETNEVFNLYYKGQKEGKWILEYYGFSPYDADALERATAYHMFVPIL